PLVLLSRDEQLHHFTGTVGLWTRRRHPFVLAALEDAELALAAGGRISRRKLLLHRREHVVVERTLHDQQRHERDRLAPLENLLWIAFVNRLPGHEERRVVLDHA